ncbi:MAG: uridylate kinase [Candidatus Parcubacteria bacterium]|nr:MAG: uridylate kinase [Candidatus Parcubacteria bacterium]
MIYVISLGGSILVPEEINIGFLRKFKNLILKEINKNKKFIIIVGGGKTARKYQEVAKKLTKISNEHFYDPFKNAMVCYTGLLKKESVKIFNEDLDWLGIHATRINAHLLLTIFRKYAYYRIIKNPKEKVNFKEKILIAAGWKPGFSTDYDAVLLAKTYKSDTVINLTNVDYVYDKDPNKFKNAQPLKEINWKDYLKLIENKWIPGMSAPFDPIASKIAQKFGIKCIIINGNKLNEFQRFLEGRKFRGTVIK